MHHGLRRTLLAGLGALVTLAACRDSTAPRKSPLAALADSLAQLAGHDPGFSERGLDLYLASLAIREGAPVNALSVTDSEGTTRDYRAVISSTTITFTGDSEPPLVLRLMIAWQGPTAERVIEAASSGDSIRAWSDMYADSAADTASSTPLPALDLSAVFLSDARYEWVAMEGGGALQLTGAPAGACAPTQRTSGSAHCANATFRVGLDFTLAAMDSTMTDLGFSRHLSAKGTLAGIVLDDTCDAACQDGMPGGVPSRARWLRLGTAALLRSRR